MRECARQREKKKKDLVIRLKTGTNYFFSFGKERKSQYFSFPASALHVLAQLCLPFQSPTPFHPSVLRMSHTRVHAHMRMHMQLHACAADKRMSAKRREIYIFYIFFMVQLSK